MKMGKKFLLGLTMVMAVSIMGCTGAKKDLSEDIVSLTSDKEISEDGNYVVVVEVKKCKSELKYELEEDNKVIASEEGIDEDVMKEYVAQEKKEGEYEYTLVVKDSDDNEVTKSIKVKVTNDSKSDDKKDEDNKDSSKTDSKNNDDNKDSKETTEKVDGDEWDSDSKSYNAGDEVVYNNKKYTCLQGHVSQESWDPMSTPALWKEKK